MSNIRVRLRPQQGIKVGNSNKYLFDPDLILDAIDTSKDWATKTDGLVDEEDYSSKAWAIGGTGTTENNSKYWAEQSADSASAASTSENNASSSATNAGASATIATTQAGIATTKATDAANSATTATTQAGIATTQAGIASAKAGEATTSAANASNSATSAYNSATAAASSAVNAGNSANIAGTHATNAEIWAEGTDAQVAGLGGEKSSKGWAQKAKEWVESIGTVLHYKGSVATYADLPTTGQEIGDMYNVLADGSNYAWDGSDWDDLSGIVDLSAYRTAAEQDIIDATFATPSDIGDATITITQGGVTKGTFTANASSDVTIELDAGGGGSATWGSIGGTLSNQTDLQNALDAKANSASLATVATSGSYNDLLNKPTIPTVNNATLTIQKNGTTVNTFTANASSNVTANITVPTNTNELTNGAGFITGINSSDVTAALGYTPANDSNVVKTSGAQTIAGVKTFTDSIKEQLTTSNTSAQYPKPYQIKDTSLDLTVNPSYLKSYDFIVFDKNNYEGCNLNLRYLTNGAATAQITAKTRNNDNSGYIQGSIGVTVNKDGTMSTFAPTPATSDNSTKIATTAFVNNWVTANTSEVAVVVESEESGYHGWRIWSNGWVEQWGATTVTAANAWQDVTLDKPYASNVYQVVACTSGTNTSIGLCKVRDYSQNTTTKFGLCVNAANTVVRWYAWGQGA